MTTDIVRSLDTPRLYVNQFTDPRGTNCAVTVPYIGMAAANVALDAGQHDYRRVVGLALSGREAAEC